LKKASKPIKNTRVSNSIENWEARKKLCKRASQKSS
jgi:hypothetical protein